MDEEKTNEAEQKKHDLTASIERMTEKLENIFSTATQAIQHTPNLESETHKWMVLSKSLGEIRHILGPCTIMPDACFHKVYEIAHPPTAAGTGGGAFFTPKQAIDFIMGNPPFGDVKDAATPLDPNAPQIALGEEPWRKIDDTESVGVRYSGNFVLDSLGMVLCQFMPTEFIRVNGETHETAKWGVDALNSHAAKGAGK